MSTRWARHFLSLGILLGWCWALLRGRRRKESLQRVPAPTVAGERRLRPVITAVALDTAGKLAAIAGDDHLVRLWEVETGKLVRELRGHQDWVRAVAFNPTSPQLASAGDDHSVRIWSLESGQLLHTLGGSGHPIHCLA